MIDIEVEVEKVVKIAQLRKVEICRQAFVVFQKGDTFECCQSGVDGHPFESLPSVLNEAYNDGLDKFDTVSIVVDSYVRLIPQGDAKTYERGDLETEYKNNPKAPFWYRKAWLRKGERTIIKVQQNTEFQNYFGALNQKSFKCNVYDLDWQNQEEILKALGKLLTEYPNKKLCLVWDNAAFHKGKLIREALKKGNLLEKVHLINLPPYAPDFNPIEHVWNTVKSNLSNKQFDSFETTKKIFMDEINKRTFNYKLWHFVLRSLYHF